MSVQVSLKGQSHRNIALFFLNKKGGTEATDSPTINEEFYTNYLHGELNINILNAENLTDKDHGIKCYGCENALRCVSIRRPCAYSKNVSDPFVSIYLEGALICKTSWRPDQ